jgi:hypothetical protein
MTLLDSLNRQTVRSDPIGAGGTKDYDMACSDYNSAVVAVRMTAGAQADLVVSLYPWVADDPTPLPVAIPPISSVGPTLATGKCHFWAHYDLTAVDKVRVHIANQNAGAQTIELMGINLA